MSAVDVASAAVKGIEQGQYNIIPGIEGKVWYRLNGIAEGLLSNLIDLVIANAMKKRNSSHIKEA
jgi:hypothetical protein